MNEGERQQEPGDQRPKKFGKADPRPRSFLVPVILLTLREWELLWVRAHRTDGGLWVRSDQPGYAVPDLEADGEERPLRV